MVRGLLSLLALLFLNGCLGGADGVQGVEDLYNQGKDIQSNQTMQSSAASDLQNQVQLLISQLGQISSMSPQSLYQGGNANKAFSLSSKILSVASNLTGGSNAPVVNSDILNSMQTRIFGVASRNPLNFNSQQTWNLVQFDVISELIKMQCSYVSLIPQYMLQLLPYMSEDDMKKNARKLKTATQQLKEEMNK